MEINDVFAYLKTELEQVDELMLEKSRSEVPLVNKVCHYIIKSGGKRVRPALLILSARICGYEGEQAIAMAAVVELTHTATLLHDDVVDGAEVRRGIPSVNHMWNNSISILGGDYLLSLAVNLVVKNGNPQILDILSTAARRMSEGEIFQHAKTGDLSISEADYIKIITAKTALIFSGACQIGAVLARASEPQEKAMADFGLALGRAFQLVDDYLDYASSESELGKTIGKDLEEGKLTLPLIYTLQKSSPEEKEFIARVIESQEFSPANLKSIQEIIDRCGGNDYTKKWAEDFCDQALGCLEVFDTESRALEALRTLSRFVVSRDR